MYHRAVEVPNARPAGVGHQQSSREPIERGPPTVKAPMAYWPFTCLVIERAPSFKWAGCVVKKRR
jgi:hypothetical protein